ncbi:hypothetical protein CDAR_451001, partial [Caerostris darwini]
SQRKGKTCY